MDIPRSRTAYSMLISSLKENNVKAFEYARLINENGTDDKLLNQISDTLLVIAKDLTRECYALFVQIIDILNCITEKETYKITAEATIIDIADTEKLRSFILTALNADLRYQQTSFEIDLLNTLVIYAIYIRDEDILTKIINKIMLLGDNL